MDTGSSRVQPSGNTIQRRIFIGPMPESVIAYNEGHGQSRRAKLTISSMFSLSAVTDQQHFRGDRNEELTRLLKDNAFNFFLREGGNADDWREEEEQDLVDELIQRWENSEWGQLWRRRHQRQNETHSNATPDRWFGTSFEVGTLLGVDILQSQGHLNAFSPRSGATASGGLHPPTTAFETFITAPSTVPQETAASAHVPEIANDATPVSSMTPLPIISLADERHKYQSEILLRPSMQTDRPKFLSETHQFMGNVKGKAKVHYSNISEDNGPPTPGPAPPEEVLERTKATVDPNTSLAATIVPDSLSSPTPSEFLWGDIVLRGDYFSQSFYTKSAIDLTERQDAGQNLLLKIRKYHTIRRHHKSYDKEP